SMSMNALLPQGKPQSVQGQRALLVQPIIDHQPEARALRSPDPRQPFQSVQSPVRQLICRRATRNLRPQPLGIAGETFVQPDVLPARNRQAVAEPLVRELVYDQPLLSPSSSAGWSG